MAERRALNDTAQNGLLWKGLKEVDSDMIDPLSWFLAAHAGYYTSSHHDACGFVTYVWIQCGVKIWSWPRPRNRAFQSRNEAVQNVLNHFSEGIVTDKWYRVRLEPADVLYVNKPPPPKLSILPSDDFRIQPPNLVHRVYTAEKSIVKGGHFYTYKTLHLTEMALLVDKKKSRLATNEDHPAVPRLLARMAMSLAYGSPPGMPIRPGDDDSNIAIGKTFQSVVYLL